VGIPGAPETITLAADAPIFNEKMGLGFIVMNDKIGVTKKTSFNSDYSFKIRISGGVLSLGLGAGLITTNTKWSELMVLDPGDESYLVDSKVFVVPDFSFGSYYYHNDFFAGFSIPRLISHQFNSDENKYNIKFQPKDYYYMFNAGYLFELNPKANFLPSALISYSPGKQVLVDINSHFSFFDKLWTGLSYRTNRSIAGFFQFQLGNQLKFAYSHNFDFGKLRAYSNGSHEIMIRYEFRYKANVVNPLIF
jgi:type IX secretion system PorP/SprF family membrane protein